MSDSKKITKEQRENMALYRALLWFGGAVILEALLLLVNRYYIHYRVGESNEIYFALALSKVFPFLCGLFVAGAAGAAVWVSKCLQKGKNAVIPGALMIAAVMASLCSFAITLFYASGVKLSLVAVPVVAALGMIYYLYQKEFFLSCVITASAILALWSIRTFNAGVKLYLLVAAMVVVIAICVALAALLQKNQGVLTVFSQRVRVFAKGSSYVPLYLSAAVSSISIIVGLFMGVTVAYYAIFLLVAMLFILAVYYTVKLM